MALCDDDHDVQLDWSFLQECIDILVESRQISFLQPFSELVHIFIDLAKECIVISNQNHINELFEISSPADNCLVMYLALVSSPFVPHKHSERIVQTVQSKRLCRSQSKIIITMMQTESVWIFRHSLRNHTTQTQFCMGFAQSLQHVETFWRQNVCKIIWLFKIS